MFDKVELNIKAGDGGDGIVSFRHEKYIPYGGPDGGDGGKGGDVIFVADSGITDLRLFRNKGHYIAGNGGNGGGQRKRGKDGADRILTVPVGTVILKKDETGEQAVISDLERNGQRAIAVRGGKGGLGNSHFATSTRQVPRIAYT